LTIHNIFQIVSAVFSVALILFGISGSLGAGGKIGNSIFIIGRRVGGCGNWGGLGNSGISGRFTLLIEESDGNIKDIRFNHNFSWSSNVMFTLYFGGSGKFGIFTSATFVGVKLNWGSRISIHKFILDRSIIMFGILNGGIGMIGNHTLGHSIDKLHE